MTSLDFTDIAEVGSKGRDDGSFLVQVSSVDTAVNAVVYSGILNEDVDGAPQCYGRFPADAGIDHLVDATRIWSVAEVSTCCPKAYWRTPGNGSVSQT